MNNRQFFIKILAEKDSLELIRPLLSKEYQVDEYDNINTFMKSMLHDPCNLLVIELNTESFDGFEAKKKARTVQPGNNLIFLSKKRDIETISKSQRQGADYLFFMPVDENRFQDALSILHRRRSYWMNLMKEVAGGKDE